METVWPATTNVCKFDNIMNSNSASSGMLLSANDEMKQKSKSKRNTHSGQFMTTNLDNDDDYVVGLGRGLGVNELEVVTINNTEAQNNGTAGEGYDFAKADKTPKSYYKFGGDKNTKDGTKFDTSLSKLFACMSIAYHGKLASPKFKAFKSIHINIKDKTRLNNIIWREWHLQYIRKHKPLVCSFSINMDDTHSKPQSVVLEGKYWKRKLEIVCIEYKKWRLFHQRKLKPKWKQDESARQKHSSGEPIGDLLKKLAEPTPQNHLQYPPVQHDNSQLSDDDLKMDFSDTLFSSLQNYPTHNTGDSHKEHSFGHADYLQPNLLGLQPCLDDFGNMDTLEPFHDLLAEAFAQTPGSYNPANSLNSIVDYPSNNSSTAFTSTTPAVPPPVYQQGALFYQPQQPPIQYQQHSSVQPVNTQKIPAYTMHFDPNTGSNVFSIPDQQQQNGNWQAVISSVQQHQPVVPIPKEEFAKPMNVQSRKHRNIAPAPRTVTSTTAATSNTQQSSFLAQLLMSSNVPQNQKPSLQQTTVAPLDLTIPQSMDLMDELTITPSDFIIQTLLSQILTTTDGSLPLLTTRNSSNTLLSPNESFTGVDNDSFSNTSPHSSEELGEEKRVVHTTAEQKRRCHIKNGFDTLTTLIPSLIQNPSTKVSKAAMLSKTAEFTRKLKHERQQMQEEAEILQQEIEALNSAISSCQCQLPATGVPVTRQHSDQMKQMLQSYITEKTLQNWKFYIFSQLATPLFDSFNNVVSTASVDELYRTTQAWMDQHCSLPALRPAVLKSLRTLGVQTSILSEPSKFPEQAREAVLKGNSTNKGS